MVVELKTKRKTKASTQPARKKPKTEHLSAKDLPWKTVSKAHEAGLDAGLEGIMELEEVEGVEVVYEETDAGKIVKFHVRVLCMTYGALLMWFAGRGRRTEEGREESCSCAKRERGGPFQNIC